jgi:hypothetical protein
MSNRIDQLFKNALGEHKVPPSAEAWTKVQSGLSKKNRTMIVWQLAAVFAFFGALVGTWYYLNNDGSITTTRLTEKNDIVVPEKNNFVKPMEATPESTNRTLAQVPATEKRKKRTEPVEIKKEIENSTNENISFEDTELQKQADEEVLVSEAAIITQSDKKEKPVVIEFTLEAISKEPITAVAQNNDEESSGLKKILETARDVKNGDSDLGIIRDAKNQLFALDFKKDKLKRN